MSLLVNGKSTVDGAEVALAVDASGKLQVASAAGSTTVGIDQTTPGTTNAVALTTASIATATLQNAASATGNGTAMNVAGYSVATVEITGTFVATAAFQVSRDGTNYYAINATAIGQDSLSTTTTTTGMYRLSVGGFNYLRLPVTWTSGTSLTAIATATIADAPPKVIKLNSGGHSAAVNIVRPANTTLYTANDAIGDTGGSAILAFSNMGIAGQDVLVTGIEVRADTATLPTSNGNLTLRLYNASPTAIADNAAWDLVSGDRSKWLGDFSIGTLVDKGSTCYIRADQLSSQVTLVSSTLYGILTTDAGITFAENSTPLTITLHASEL